MLKKMSNRRGTISRPAARKAQNIYIRYRRRTRLGSIRRCGRAVRPERPKCPTRHSGSNLWGSCQSPPGSPKSGCASDPSVLIQTSQQKFHYWHPRPLCVIQRGRGECRIGSDLLVTLGPPSYQILCTLRRRREKTKQDPSVRNQEKPRIFILYYTV